MFHQLAHFEHPSFMITDTRLFNSSKILTVAVRASSQRHFPMYTCAVLVILQVDGEYGTAGNVANTFPVPHSNIASSNCWGQRSNGIPYLMCSWWKAAACWRALCSTFSHTVPHSWTVGGGAWWKTTASLVQSADRILAHWTSLVATSEGSDPEDGT